MAAEPSSHVQAYILVDACSKKLADRLQHGLRCMANVLSVMDDPCIEPALGLCLVKRSLATKDVQLQVLLQPHQYNLRDWHLQLSKIQPSEAHQQPDNKKLAMAIKTLLDYLKGQSAKAARKSLAQHLHVIAHTFTFIPTYTKLLQEAASCGVHVNFCWVSPYDAAGSTTACADFFAAVTCHESATCCSVECNDHSLGQMLLDWVTEEFSSPQHTLQLRLPKPVAGKDTLLCSCSQVVARIKNTCQPACLCSCHMAPVLPSSATDAVCSVTTQRSACKPEKSVVLLGHHTALRLSAFSSALPKLQLHAPGAAPGLPALEVLSTIRLQDVNQAAIYGRAQLLRGIPHDLVGDTPVPGPGSQGSDTSVLAAITETLLRDQKALLATSLFDTDAEATGFLKTHYILRPTGVPGSLLCCKLASAEQLLAVEEANEAVPSEDLMAVVSQELGAWQPAGLGPVGFLPTSLTAGYHDLLNQLVRDSQKPPPLAAVPAAAAAAAAAAGPPAATAPAAAGQRDAKRMALGREGGPRPAGADQNQQPADGAAGGGQARQAAGKKLQQTTGAVADAAPAAATKGKAAAGRQRASSDGPSATGRSGRAPLQALQLTRK